MPLPARPIKFWSMSLSGNAHRVLLALKALDLPYELIEVNLREKQQKTPEFLAMNPFGQVPVIDDDGTVIWDSIAILTYLGLTYDDGQWLPRDPAAFAQLMAWLGKTSGPIAYGLATARRINVFKAPQDMTEAQRVSHDFLATLETCLGGDWLVAGRPTLADLGCYAYIAHAPEGGVDLSAYPRTESWLKRLEALPFFAAMPKSAAGLWA